MSEGEEALRLLGIGQTVNERNDHVVPDEAARAHHLDLSLADGTLEGEEHRFLGELGSDLKLKAATVQQILDVVVVRRQL